MNQPFLTGAMRALLNEPSVIATGFDDGNVAVTITESKTFLRNASDPDSDVIFAREIDKNADGDTLSSSVWSVANAPSITDVVTDASDDSVIFMGEETELTIAGENFGAEDADLQVLVFVRQKNRVDELSPTPFGNRIRLQAEISSVSVGDDEIVATITLSPLFGYSPGLGPCEVQVFNKKRLLVSNEFQLTVRE